MNIGVPKEIKENEGRVGLAPTHVAALKRAGHILLVEECAGLRSGFSDAEYTRAGARMEKTAKAIYAHAELVVKVKEPLESEYPLIQNGQILFTYLHLASDPELIHILLQKNITGIDYATVRTAAGRLPLLEPMSEIAGKLAPQIGARLLEQHAGKGRGVLLAGTEETEPATVMVIGGGVVGTHAARIAAGMGARVFLLEKNPVRLEALARTFAAQTNVRPLLATQKKLAGLLKKTDLVVTAVLIPGGKAPILILKKHLTSMPSNSVIVDVSIDQGGCVEGGKPTSHADPAIHLDGVLYCGIPNIPSLVPATATRALTARTFPYVKILAQVGFAQAVRKNAALAQGVNTYGGHITNEQLSKDLGKEYGPLNELLK